VLVLAALARSYLGCSWRQVCSRSLALGLDFSELFGEEPGWGCTASWIPAWRRRVPSQSATSAGDERVDLPRAALRGHRDGLPLEFPATVATGGVLGQCHAGGRDEVDAEWVVDA
jgi:hypothetical protein